MAMELERLRQRLHTQPPEQLTRGDRDLNPGWPLPSVLKPAAVLVPLIVRPAGYHILLTQRPPDMKEHPGQVSFPGGRVDDTDTDATATALREAQEEVGLAPDLVQPLGWLETYITITGYRVTPLVGLVERPPLWQPSAREVAAIIELPVEKLIVPDSIKVRGFRILNGQERRTYTLLHNGVDIWGATAAMLLNLKELLRDET
jgi:8-oxo-dGTP pyrophosphatase MutT (NUDIX family)